VLEGNGLLKPGPASSLLMNNDMNSLSPPLFFLTPVQRPEARTPSATASYWRGDVGARKVRPRFLAAFNDNMVSFPSSFFLFFVDLPPNKPSVLRRRGTSVSSALDNRDPASVPSPPPPCRLSSQGTLCGSATVFLMEADSILILRRR